MNYAEDRLDRRARHVGSSSEDGLWADYQDGLKLLDHALLARTLRDIGWCRHATFHYGMAFLENPKQVGDYAQMVELAGFPELGVLALLYYRSGQRPALIAQQQQEPKQQPHTDPSWLRQNPPPRSDCGCGFVECGHRLCFLSASDLQPVIDALNEYTRACPSRLPEMPSTASVFASLANSKAPYIPTGVPDLLQFWKEDDDDKYIRLDPVLQLLLVKLLYVTVPALAAEAIVHLQFDNSRKLANEYKSHWAYYVLIRAVVLGERIKPHRRKVLGTRYHVPVWDLLWQKDQRVGHEDNSEATLSGNIIEWSKVLHDCVVDTTVMPRVQWCLPTTKQHKPLFVVGDSHVLSIAWTQITIPNNRLLVPLVVTGLKAWHTRKDTYFFTNYLLHSCLRRLPKDARTILLSAGEIDCREGIGGPLLQGYTSSATYKEYVHRTAQEYIQAVQDLATKYSLQILVMPVAPHARRSDRNGKVTGRAFRRNVTCSWNDELKRALPREGVFLLDYQEKLRDKESAEYVLNPSYNADYTHMNSAFLPHLESAIEQRGCDTSLL